MKDKISPDKIKSYINTEFTGCKINCYDCVISTNLTAKENHSEPEGTVFIAEHQLKGRGRLQREWTSEASSGIYMSILLKPPLSPDRLSVITLVTGLAAASALNKISKEKVCIKWPNDLLINSKKVCGILTELSVSEQGKYNVIAGIGLNVNNTSFPAELQDKATSLFMENQQEYDRSQLVGILLSEFEEYYNKFLKYGFSALSEEYSRLCVTIGNEVEIISPSEKYTAYALGIDSEGRLLVKRGEETRAVSSGEVSVRGLLGYA